MSELVGRRRCKIPEHRRQIKAMQKWCAYLQSLHAEHWSRLTIERQKVEELRRELAAARAPTFRTFAIGCVFGIFLVALGKLLN